MTMISVSLRINLQKLKGKTISLYNPGQKCSIELKVNSVVHMASQGIGMPPNDKKWVCLLETNLGPVPLFADSEISLQGGRRKFSDILDD